MDLAWGLYSHRPAVAAGFHCPLMGGDKESCDAASAVIDTLFDGTVTNPLKAELIAKLSGLKDEETVAIRQVYEASAIYRGPYIDAAPDMLVGYARCYRTSWDAALGKVTGRVFEDNLKAWSGDHCVDPTLVPGVLFSNMKVDTDEGQNAAGFVVHSAGVAREIVADDVPQGGHGVESGRSQRQCDM